MSRAFKKAQENFNQYNIKKMGVVLNFKRIGVAEPNQF